MLFYRLVISLTALSFSALIQAEQVLSLPVQNNKNSMVTTYSSEADNVKNAATYQRTIDFPTQIIRINTDLKQELTCEEVGREVERIFISQITPNRFLYATYINCVFDTDTLLAKHLLINSYFDPINDEAVEYLKSYLAQYNNTDFLGTQWRIESAKSLIISLQAKAGLKKKPHTPPFVEYRSDRSNFYFNNNLDWHNAFFRDVRENFFSNEPEKIFPFLNKWIFTNASVVYKSVLRDANYMELQPERIFLMETGEPIFVSELKYFYAHSCLKYDNQRCLK